MTKNYFEADIEKMPEELEVEREEDVVYSIAFNILCATRKVFNPIKYEKNQDQNQDDLNNELVPQVMKALFEAMKR